MARRTFSFACLFVFLPPNWQGLSLHRHISVAAYSTAAQFFLVAGVRPDRWTCDHWTPTMLGTRQGETWSVRGFRTNSGCCLGFEMKAPCASSGPARGRSVRAVSALPRVRPGESPGGGGGVCAAAALGEARPLPFCTRGPRAGAPHHESGVLGVPGRPCPSGQAGLSSWNINGGPSVCTGCRGAVPLLLAPA